MVKNKENMDAYIKAWRVKTDGYQVGNENRVDWPFHFFFVGLFILKYFFFGSIDYFYLK